MKYRGKLTGAIFGTAAGLLLAWLLLRGSAGGSGVSKAAANVIDLIRGADHTLLLAAFGLFLASQFLRALRWILLEIERKYGFTLSAAVTAIHVGLGHLLPLRLADLAFVGLFRRYGSVPVGHGTANVVFAKLLDIMAMGVVVGSVAAGGIGNLVIAAPALVLVGFLGILFMSPLLRRIGRPVRWLLGRIVPGDRTHWFDDLLAASSVKGRKRRLLAAFAVSVLVWAAKLYMFVLLLESLGVTGIPEWKIFLASAVTNVVMALPVHGLLSVGTVEASWTAAFAVVGVDGGALHGVNIVELGFSVHILWMLMAVLPMLFALPVPLLLNRRAAGVQKSAPGGGS